MLKTLQRYYYALSYMKYSQIYNRLMRRFHKSNFQLVTKYSTRKIKHINFFEFSGTHLDPTGTKIKILNKNFNARDWHSNVMNSLELYNLHYLSCVPFLQNKNRANILLEYIRDWIRSNTVDYKNRGWDAYPVSLRSKNIIKFLFLNEISPDDEVLFSLKAHGAVLEKKLEWHLRCNHLLSNVVALFFLGSLFDDADGQRWFQLAVNILDSELDDQFLPGGAHVELSPMYTCHIVSELIDIISLIDGLGLLVPPWFRAKLIKCSTMACYWLDSICHPNGQLPHFNDSVNGLYISVSDIKKMLSHLGVATQDYEVSTSNLDESSGYFRFCTDRAFLVGNVGVVGPDYNPGHAHAQELSFEASVHGKRMIVNSGLSTYEDCDLRHFQRSTRAHSTIEVEGQNSTDVWKSFRVGKRAKVRVKRFDVSSMIVEAEHDGYGSIWRPCKVSRVWKLDSQSLTVRDTVSNESSPAISRFYVHPDWQLSWRDDIPVFTCDFTQVEVEVIDGKLIIQDAEYFPSFNVSQPNNVISVKFLEGKAAVKFLWTDSKITASSRRITV